VPAGARLGCPNRNRTTDAGSDHCRAAGGEPPRRPPQLCRGGKSVEANLRDPESTQFCHRTQFGPGERDPRSRTGFAEPRRRTHGTVSRLKRGAVTCDVRASFPQPPPLVSDPDIGYWLRVEPVRPPEHNGCPTLHAQGSPPAGRFEADAHAVRRVARAGLPATRVMRSGAAELWRSPSSEASCAAAPFTRTRSFRRRSTGGPSLVLSGFPANLPLQKAVGNGHGGGGREVRFP
jgi:hypothetical protein